MLDHVAVDLRIQQVERSVIYLQVSRLPAARDNAADVGNVGGVGHFERRTKNTVFDAFAGHVEA